MGIVEMWSSVLRGHYFDMCNKRTERHKHNECVFTGGISTTFYLNDFTLFSFHVQYELNCHGGKSVHLSLLLSFYFYTNETAIF